MQRRVRVRHRHRRRADARPRPRPGAQAGGRRPAHEGHRDAAEGPQRHRGAGPWRGGRRPRAPRARRRRHRGRGPQPRHRHRLRAQRPARARLRRHPHPLVGSRARTHGAAAAGGDHRRRGDRRGVRLDAHRHGQRGHRARGVARILATTDRRSRQRGRAVVQEARRQRAGGRAHHRHRRRTRAHGLVGDRIGRAVGRRRQGDRVDRARAALAGVSGSRPAGVPSTTAASSSSTSSWRRMSPGCSRPAT